MPLLDAAWSAVPGVMRLPGGAAVRGRRIEDEPWLWPDLGLYLTARRPEPRPWPASWITWVDFGLPRRPERAWRAIRHTHAVAADHRVEVACDGGRGRTGTVLACLVVCDGLAPRDAVAWVRRTYDRGAVEMPWQHTFVRRFDVWLRATAARDVPQAQMTAVPEHATISIPPSPSAS